MTYHNVRMLCSEYASLVLWRCYDPIPTNNNYCIQQNQAPLPGIELCNEGRVLYPLCYNLCCTFTDFSNFTFSWDWNGTNVYYHTLLISESSSKVHIWGPLCTHYGKVFSTKMDLCCAIVFEYLHESNMLILMFSDDDWWSWWWWLWSY